MNDLPNFGMSTFFIESQINWMTGLRKTLKINKILKNTHQDPPNCYSKILENKGKRSTKDSEYKGPLSEVYLKSIDIYLRVGN